MRNPDIRQNTCTVLVACAITTACAGHLVAAEGDLVAFDGQLALREAGKPAVETFEFFSYEASATIRLFNGGRDGMLARASSATVTVNGRAIASPEDFNQQVGELVRTFEAQAHNVLEVTLRGKPGAGIEFDVVVPLPAGSKLLSVDEFSALARTQADYGDTLRLLTAGGYRVTVALAREDEKGRSQVVAELRNADGRPAIYTTDPGTAFGIEPAAILREREEVWILQRPGGLRFREDANGEVLHEEHVLAVLGMPTAEVASAASVEPAGISSSCDPFGTEADPSCAENFTAQVLACRAVSAPLRAGCPICVATIAACFPSITAGPGILAGCFMLLEPASGFSCARCLGGLLVNAGCQQIDIPCDTGCQEACVTAATCAMFYCRAREVSEGNSCRPEGGERCAAETLPGDDFYIGERTGVCDAVGFCKDGPIRPCDLPDCRSCREELGGCAADPDLEGSTCTDGAGGAGICVDGWCDTGAAFDPDKEVPGARDAVWELQLATEQTTTDPQIGPYLGHSLDVSGHFTHFMPAMRDSRSGEATVDATFLRRFGGGPSCNQSVTSSFDDTSARPFGGAGGCVRLEFQRDRFGSRAWVAKLVWGGCCYVYPVIDGTRRAGTTCKLGLGCVYNNRAVTVSYPFVEIPFDPTIPSGSEFKWSRGTCDVSSRIQTGTLPQITVNMACRSVDRYTAAVTETTLEATLARRE